jgi:hypothetical protein
MSKPPQCPHDRVEAGEYRPFAGCVAGEGCEPRSHGGLRYVDTCRDCGQQRDVNLNRTFIECSAWRTPPSKQAAREPT